MEKQCGSGCTQSSKKQIKSGKPELFNQIIKLTKQNQYLLTKIDCLYSELQKIASLKEKYRKKYKQIKTEFQKLQKDDKNFVIPTKKNFPHCCPSVVRCHSSKTLQSIDNPYALPQFNQTPQINRIRQSLSKIDSAILEFSEKINSINQGLYQNLNHEVWVKIGELSQKINILASQFQNKQKSMANSRQYGLQGLNFNVPVKENQPINIKTNKQLNRFRFIQSRSQHSFQRQLLRNGRVKRQRIASQNSAKKQQEWELLKQIGHELKNWKFSMSEVSRSIKNEPTTH